MNCRPAASLACCFLAGCGALQAPGPPVGGADTAAPHPGEADAAPVFFSIIMGQLVEKHQVRLWLSSLRRNGRWTGSVVLVTDFPACLVNNLGPGLLGAQEPQAGDPAVATFRDSNGSRVHILEVPVARDLIQMKLHKTRIWEHLRRVQLGHPVSAAIYTDEDIIFGESLEAFFKEVQALEGGDRTLALFEDPGISEGQLHTGVVVSWPTVVSEVCLRGWGANLAHFSVLPGAASLAAVGEAEAEAAGRRGIDQKVLAGTLECGGGRGMHLLPRELLYLPDDEGMSAGRTGTFIHLTNTNRWLDISPVDIEDYMGKVLGLPKALQPTAKTKCDASIPVPPDR